MKESEDVIGNIALKSKARLIARGFQQLHGHLDLELPQWTW